MDLAKNEKQKQTDCCTLWMQSSATPPASHKKDILLHVGTFSLNVLFTL